MDGNERDAPKADNFPDQEVAEASCSVDYIAGKSHKITPTAKPVMASQRKNGFHEWLASHRTNEKKPAKSGKPMTRLSANFRFSARPGFQLTSANGFMSS